MRAAGRLGVGALCAAGLLLAGLQDQRVYVSAQAQVIPEGAYELREHKKGPRTVTPRMDILHIFVNNRYGWEDDHANFRIMPDDLQLDCRSDWRGTYYSQDREMEFEFLDPNNIKNKLRLRYLGPVTAHPRKERLRQWRDCGYGRMGAVPARTLEAGLQAQAAARPVTGELLLTTRENASVEDLNTWRCLTDDYPRLEFREVPDGQTDRAFVFPDGRFRMDLRGGAVYEWTPLPSGCGIQAGQRGGGRLPQAPAAAPPTAEKIVLACFVSNRSLQNCHSWWLTRP